MLNSLIFTKVFVLMIGLIYPSYQSFKAIRNQDTLLYTQWLIYWIIYSIFLSIERFFDHFYLWFPFYYELKIILTIWLVSPATKGSTRLYAHHLHPFLVHREMEIDSLIKAFNSLGYSAIKRLFRYFFDLILAAFGKAHMGVIELIKVKYNLKEATPDLSVEAQNKKIKPKDDVDSQIDIKFSYSTQTSSSSIYSSLPPSPNLQQNLAPYKHPNDLNTSRSNNLREATTSKSSVSSGSRFSSTRPSVTQRLSKVTESKPINARAGTGKSPPNVASYYERYISRRK